MCPSRPMGRSLSRSLPTRQASLPLRGPPRAAPPQRFTSRTLLYALAATLILGTTLWSYALPSAGSGAPGESPGEPGDFGPAGGGGRLFPELGKLGSAAQHAQRAISKKLESVEGLPQIPLQQPRPLQREGAGEGGPHGMARSLGAGQGSFSEAAEDRQGQQEERGGRVIGGSREGAESRGSGQGRGERSVERFVVGEGGQGEAGGEARLPVARGGPLRQEGGGGPGQREEAEETPEQRVARLRGLVRAYREGTARGQLPRVGQGPGGAAAGARAPPRCLAGQNATLVVYALHAWEDEELLDNFYFFVQSGMAADPGLSYLVLLPEGMEEPAQLGEGASYLRIPPGLCHWGALGAALAQRREQLGAFEHFFFLSAFVRGPFLPAYVQGAGVHWTRLFAAQLDPGVRLVSPTLSCEAVRGLGEVRRGERGHPSLPHISPHLFATDRAGLDLLLADGGVFSCPPDPAAADPLALPAARASQVVLEAGHNLAALMLRYQGVDWRDEANWDCNARMSPSRESSYDGASLNPLEVVFVELGGDLLRSGLSAPRLAKKYDAWSKQQLLAGAGAGAEVSSNLYSLDPLPFQTAAIARMERRGPGCFDRPFYLRHSPELAGQEAHAVWQHFVRVGQFEGRRYRFSCVDYRARGAGCFDDDFYHSANGEFADARAQGRGMSSEECWQHFLTQGMYQGRSYRFKDACGEDLDSPNRIS